MASIVNPSATDVETLKNEILSILENNNDDEIFPAEEIEMIRNINDIDKLKDILKNIKQEIEMNNMGKCYQTDGIPMENVKQTFETTNKLVTGSNCIHTITLESEHSPTMKITKSDNNPVIICELFTEKNIKEKKK